MSSFLINEDQVSVLSLAMSALSDRTIVEMSAGTVCYKIQMQEINNWENILVKKDKYDVYEDYKL